MNSKRWHWFEIAEYSSLVGLIVALVYRQIAIAPLLSTFIWLNLKNRRYFEHATNAAIQNAVQPVYEQLSEIRSTLQSLSNSQNETQVIAAEVKQFANDELGKLQTRLIQGLGAQAAKSQAFQEQVEQLSQTIENLHLQLEQQPQPFDSTEIEQKVEALNQRVEKVEQQITPLVNPAFMTLIQALEAEVLSLQQQIQMGLSYQYFEEWQEEHVVPLQITIESLTSRVDGFDKVNVQIVQETEASLAALAHQLKSVNQQVDNLSANHSVLHERIENLDLVKKHLQDLDDKFEILNEGGQHLNSVKTALTALKQQVVNLDASCTALHNRVQVFDLIEGQLQSLVREFESSNEKLQTLEPTKTALASLKQQVESVRQQIDDLDASCATLHDRTRNVDQVEEQVQKLEENAQELRDRVQILEPLQNQVAHLAAKNNRIDDFEQMLTNLSKQFEGYVSESVERHMIEINQRLQEIQPHFEYKLVFDRAESRERLIQALDQCQEHLILVCPWLTEYAIDSNLTWKLRTLLNKKRRVDIGWGNFKDVEDVRYQPGSMRENLRRSSGYYNALSELERLEQQHSTFQLKLMGTHEKYLVCDRRFAMLGSHNFLTSNKGSKEREIGFYTTDPKLIDRLIQRFNAAHNLEQRSAC